MDTKKVVALLESALKECKAESPQTPAPTDPPPFEVGDIVKLNWRTENDIAKITRGSSPDISQFVEVWFVDNTGREGWTSTAKNLTLLSPATPLVRELGGISVGDIILKNGQYREIVLIDLSCSLPYGVYVPLKDSPFTPNLLWYKKEDIGQVFKFPQGNPG